MFTAENEDVLVAFQALCEQYPRENPVALWEMAGGQVAAEQSVHPTALCAGHSGGSIAKEGICQECGLPIPRIG